MIILMHGYDYDAHDYVYSYVCVWLLTRVCKMQKDCGAIPARNGEMNMLAANI